jgi:uncharacterized protein YqeY
MSDLKTRITDDVKTAMKAGDKARVNTLRMLTAELKQREVVDAVEMNDGVVIASIEKMIKQRRDAEKQYRDGGRPELADAEAAEIVVLSAYLPKALDESELNALIGDALRETGASSAKDMGKVMAWLKPKIAGRADMGKVSALIKVRLG